MSSPPRSPRRAPGWAGRLLALAALLGGALALAGQEPAPAPDAPLLGTGRHTYRWVRDWAKLPAGKTLETMHGCVVVDGQDNVYVNTDGPDAVVVFDRQGNFVRAFGEELAGGLHGMQLVVEDETPFLYLTHIVRGELIKTTLEGEVLWTLGYPEQAGIYADASEYHPTSVAVAADGELYVADGYGKSWVHRYDRERKYLGSFGGPGKEPGKLGNPHGVWIVETPERRLVIVADRENARLQVFDREGKLLRVIADGLRRPCHAHEQGGELVVADIDGKVTVLDRNGAVLTHLGENPDLTIRKKKNVPRALWRDGLFISPHCARWDSHGDLYVVDWLTEGRITKLERVR